MADEAELLGGATELVLGQRYQRQFWMVSPGTGKSWQVVVPGGVRWRLISLEIGYTSDATAGDRLLQLVLVKEQHTIIDCPAGIAHPPSTGLLYGWFVGAALVTTVSPGRTHTAPVPSCWLEAGWSFYLPIPAGYTGDAWLASTVWVEEERIGPPPPREIVRAVPLAE
jgi:hypothetical protein